MKTVKLILISCVVIYCSGLPCYATNLHDTERCPCHYNGQQFFVDTYGVLKPPCDTHEYKDVLVTKIFYNGCQVFAQYWGLNGAYCSYTYSPEGCTCPCGGHGTYAVASSPQYKPVKFTDSNGTISRFVAVDEGLSNMKIIDLATKAVVYDYNSSVPAGVVATIPTGGLELGHKYIMVGFSSEGNMKSFLPFTKLQDWVQELPHSDWTGMGRDGLERGCNTYLDSNGVKILVQSPDKSWVVVDSNSPVPVPPCVQAIPNIVAWWSLDENSTPGGVSHDIVYGNDGNWVGSPVAVAGKVDGGLQLDGYAYVQAPNDVTLNFGTGDFSIDAWVKTSEANNLQIILEKRSGIESHPNGYQLYLSSGKLGLLLGDGDYTLYQSTLLPSVADGNWHHVAATVNRDDPNGLKLYVDGVSQTFNPTTRTGSLDNDANLLIGAYHYNSTFRFNGDIDEVDLFKRALDPYEIQSIFRAGSDGKCKQKPESACKKADFNDDDIVNFEDFAIFADCWLVDCKQ
jgi:hypothetical protein